jgi:hypothetical protein
MEQGCCSGLTHSGVGTQCEPPLRPSAMTTRSWPFSIPFCHCRPRRRSRRHPSHCRRQKLVEALPSPAAAAAHAAAVVAADILVLPNSISTAAALTFDVLWDHLLELCQRDGSQQLRAGCERRHSIAPAAAHRAVLRWPGGRLLCLRLLPPPVHRRIVENRCDRERSNHMPLPAYAAACAGALTTCMRVLVCLCFAAGHRSHRGAEKVPKSRVAQKRSLRIA